MAVLPDHVNLRTRLGVFILGLALAVTGTGLYTQYRVRQVTQCQYELNKQVLDALQKRSEFPAQESAANRALFESLLNPALSREQRIDAVNEYISKSKKIEQARKALPYPDGDCHE